MTSSWIEATKLQYDDDTNLAARQALFNFLVDATPMAPPMDDMSALADQRVLDVGCGNGLFLANAVIGGASAIGLDSSFVMASVAATHAPVLQADAEALPLTDGSFDTVLALWMLYHMPNVPRALREFQRVLVNGGQLVVTTNSGDQSSAMDLIVRSSLGQVLSREVDHWHAPIGFSSENGAVVLEEVFPRVDVFPFGTTFDVTDAEVLVRYAGSMLEPITEEFGDLDSEALLAQVGERSEAEIEAKGAVHVNRSGTVFLAR